MNKEKVVFISIPDATKEEMEEVKTALREVNFPFEMVIINKAVKFITKAELREIFRKVVKDGNL